MQQIRKDFSLASYNTFGVDVEARHFVEVDSIEGLEHAIATSFDPKMILGGGSNILFTGPYEGLIIRNKIEYIEVVEEGAGQVTLEVGAGVTWHDLVRWTLRQGYGGLENLSLIPGTVGAAPIQNIGAYGVEFASVFDRLEAVDMKTGSRRSFDHDECAFGYRYSVFKGPLRGKYAIANVRLKLTTADHRIRTDYGAIAAELANRQITSPSPQDISEAVIKIRRSKLPDPGELGNAGSFFQNPTIARSYFDKLQRTYPQLKGYPQPLGVKISAAWLIEQCGWKGYRRDDVGIYDRHALVLVNHGRGTGAELRDLAVHVAGEVQEKFGIWLVPEVQVI